MGKRRIEKGIVLTPQQFVSYKLWVAGFSFEKGKRGQGASWDPDRASVPKAFVRRGIDMGEAIQINAFGARFMSIMAMPVKPAGSPSTKTVTTQSQQKILKKIEWSIEKELEGLTG